MKTLNTIIEKFNKILAENNARPMASEERKHLKKPFYFGYRECEKYNLKDLINSTTKVAISSGGFYLSSIFNEFLEAELAEEELNYTIKFRHIERNTYALTVAFNSIKDKTGDYDFKGLESKIYTTELKLTLNCKSISTKFGNNDIYTFLPKMNANYFEITGTNYNSKQENFDLSINDFLKECIQDCVKWTQERIDRENNANNAFLEKLASYGITEEQFKELYRSKPNNYNFN